MLFMLICVALWRKKGQPNLAIKFCVLMPLGFIVALAFAAYFKKIQGNWCDFIYPLMAVAVAWGCCECMPSLRKWAVASTSLSGLLMLALPMVASFSKQNVGHRQLTDVLHQVGYRPLVDFLFGDKYQTSSLLSFYGPAQQRAYFLNLHGIRKNQFSYWPGMEVEQLHKTGFFVCT